LFGKPKGLKCDSSSFQDETVKICECASKTGGPFGLRWQSGAATALWNNQLPSVVSMRSEKRRGALLPTALQIRYRYAVFIGNISG
jgi:hypothetical protein